MREESLYELLRDKEIIAILDGDKELGRHIFEDGSSVPISMPYLSGPNICALSARFGLSQEYTWGGGNPSRWQYFDDLIKHCIANCRCSELLSDLFAREQFNKILRGHSRTDIDNAHKVFVETAINHINGVLDFGGHELVSAGGAFTIREIGQDVVVEAPIIEKIDRDYVREMSERAMEDVSQGRYDSAITHTRTLLEEVFCYVLEKKKIKPSTSGNMSELYKQVKNAYNMHTDPGADKRINTLLSGLNSIVSAVSEMRNKDSDAHGVGASRIKIHEHHARLFVNSAMTMADFILSVAKNQL